jgi:hypothetical protein
MLTVVIPTRNRQKELISLLEYLKSQVIVNEIISSKNKTFFCENKDIQSIVNYFSVRFFSFFSS